ncbi:MAG: glycosyltransferase [Lachnospiraceae bacterium]|nr:glycosyltransferase [Lachnospiraceae bacterium]
MIKISFIVPIYNDEQYIAQCIESLCAQKEQELEFLLIDDGSTDDSLNICRKYEKQDSRIRVYHQTNQGANVARNKGLMEAKGKWVCFIDGDDWIESNFCDTLDQYMSQDYDVIIYSFYKVFGNDKKRMESNAEKIEFKEADFVDLQISSLNRLGPYKYNLKCLDPVSCWNKIYKRNFLIENHIAFIPEIQKLQDLTFNLQVYDYAKNGIYLNTALYDYRYNPASVTNRYQPDIVHKFDVIHEFLLPFVQNKPQEIFESVFWERIATHSRTCTVLYFCNRKNEKSYAERKKEFLDLMDKEPYATAIKRVNLCHFPVKEKILSIVIRLKWFLGCEMLTLFQSILR